MRTSIRPRKSRKPPPRVHCTHSITRQNVGFTTTVKIILAYAYMHMGIRHTRRSSVRREEKILRRDGQWTVRLDSTKLFEKRRRPAGERGRRKKMYNILQFLIGILRILLLLFFTPYLRFFFLIGFIISFLFERKKLYCPIDASYFN